MAEVWLAVDTKLDRRVAIKILHAHLAGDPEFVARFRREALAVAKLSHPNVVAVFDTGVDRGEGSNASTNSPYIVMEFVNGESLRTLLQKGITQAEAVQIVAQSAEGLSYAHKNGLVHRDVKPANILIQPNGAVKVVDFGIAKAASGLDANPEDLTQVGAILGTAKYLSPEQVEGAGIDKRADIYSLGVVLYEAVCGRPPFVGSNDMATAVQHVRGNVPPPRSIRAGIPRALEQVILRAMQRDPSRRFADASEMARALRTIDLSKDDAVPLTSRTTDDITPPSGLTDVRQDATSVQTRVGRASAEVRPLERPQPSGSGRFTIVPLLGTIFFGLLIGALIGRVLADRSQHSSNGTVIVLPAGSVQTYDPYAGDGEHDADVPLLVDTNPATAWSTSTYRTRDFNGNKPGVGIRFRIPSDEVVRHLRIETPSTGWSASVYASDTSPENIEDWGDPVGLVQAVGQRETTIKVSPVSGKYLLFWITDLGPTKPSRVIISELRPRT